MERAAACPGSPNFATGGYSTVYPAARRNRPPGGPSSISSTTFLSGKISCVGYLFVLASDAPKKEQYRTACKIVRPRLEEQAVQARQVVPSKT